MTTSLERRVRQKRSRALVRAWAYRQRHHARGVWYRLRRVLAEASAAYAVNPEDARRLVAEGHPAVPVGAEIQPPRLIVFAPPERVARIASAHAIEVRLSGELLNAEALVLTPFAP